MITTEQIDHLMAESIRESLKSVAEDESLHPKVGAILAGADGNILASAHRGELGPGNHAEYNLLRKAERLAIDLKSCILFVTLEPCSQRSIGKIACAQRIVEAGIQTVYVGLTDPDVRIASLGEFYLRTNKVRVEHFPSNLVSQIMQLNDQWIAEKNEARLSPESLYSRIRINDVITDQLKRDGFHIATFPHGWDVTISDLIRATGNRLERMTRRKATFRESRRTHAVFGTNGRRREHLPDAYCRSL